MNTIKLIGVNHNDPYGRRIIADYLSFEKSNGFLPDCLATEWDHEMFLRVYKQRDYLYNKLISERFTNNLLEARIIADSLGFEADSHLTVYPNIPIVWLDQGRKVQDDIIQNYADQRYEILSAYRQENEKCFDLDKTRHSLIAISKDNLISNIRDTVFASKISNAIENGMERIICIVGEEHTKTDIKGRLGYQLKEKGFSLSVYNTTEH